MANRRLGSFFTVWIGTKKKIKNTTNTVDHLDKDVNLNFLLECSLLSILN